MGFEKKASIQAILTGKYNQPAGTYYLLAWQKLNKSMGHESNEEVTARMTVQSKEQPETTQAHNNLTSDELANVLFEVERATRSPTGERTALQNKELNRLKPSRQAASPAPAGRHLNRRLVTLKKQDRKEVGSEDDVRKGKEEFLLPKIGQDKSQKNGGTKDLKLPAINMSDASRLTSGDAFGTLEQSQPASLKSRKGHKATPIPIDESLYLPKEQDTIGPDVVAGVMGMPRTIRFAFNCTATTPLAPDLLFEKLKNILDKNDVEWHHDGYLCECNWGDIKFEVEICKMPRLNSFGIRLKRILGDIWEYKKLCSKITSEIDVNGV